MQRKMRDLKGKHCVISSPPYLKWLWKISTVVKARSLKEVTRKYFKSMKNGDNIKFLDKDGISNFFIKFLDKDDNL